MPPVLTLPISLPPIFVGDSGPNTVDCTLAMNAQPQALTVKPNALITLTAPTTGNQLQPVQWQVSTNNGKTWTNVPMSSAVQANKLVVTASSSTNNAQYRAQLVSTSKGAATQTTNAVALNVVKAPTVAVQASTLKTAVGKKVTLTATVKGSTATQIQWQVQNAQSNAWSNIDGATSLTYSFTVAATDNGSRYRVIVNNSAGTADSTAVTLKVTFPPTVTSPPTAQTVLVGTKATFTATASANPAPTVQWQASVNNGKTWVNLQNGPSVQGVHTGTLTITTKSAENGEQFRAVFTSGKAVASIAAVLTVQTPVPVVTITPASETVIVNGQATFVAAATGATAMQWQISTDDGQTWTNVRGATSKTLHVKASLSKSGEQFRMVFTNAGGTTKTAAATLTVEDK
jgi:hypothetical protein